MSVQLSHTDSKISESPGSEMVITHTLWSLPHAVPLSSYKHHLNLPNSMLFPSK